jgi:hypothetical protein
MGSSRLTKVMIRRCDKSEFEVINAIINDSAQAYKGVIPPTAGKNPICLETNSNMR